MGIDEDAKDKSNYPPGPWHHEPDRLEWRQGGLPCLIIRGPVGSLNGYVGVYNEHPWFRGHYDRVDVRVHGGLTYSGRGEMWMKDYKRQEGDRDSEIWWFGFDCAHAGDLAPGMLVLRGAPRLFRGDIYRDIEYVKGQVKALAIQVLQAKRLSKRVKFAVDQAKALIRDAVDDYRSVTDPGESSLPPELQEKMDLLAARMRRKREE